MTDTATGVDYDAARDRLQGITTDAAALDSFELVVKSGEILDTEFLRAAQRLNISLDYVFLGAGNPHRKGEAS